MVDNNRTDQFGSRSAHSDNVRHRRIFQHGRVAVIGTSAVAVAMLAIPAAASSAQLVWNMSASAPAGLYRVERSGWTVGDRVAVLPAPDLADDLERRGILQRGKLLIKRLAATAGETVCRQQDVVTINGRAVARAKVSGSDGVLLPSWKSCVTLRDQQIFLLGDGVDSYDGRYFGPTSEAEVVGRAVILVSF